MSEEYPNRNAVGRALEHQMKYFESVKSNESLLACSDFTNKVIDANISYLRAITDKVKESIWLDQELYSYTYQIQDALGRYYLDLKKSKAELLKLLVGSEESKYLDTKLIDNEISRIEKVYRDYESHLEKPPGQMVDQNVR